MIARLRLLLVFLAALIGGCAATVSSEPNTPFRECGKSQLDAILGRIPEKVARRAPLPCLNYYEDIQKRPAQDPNLAVAVAISGGGHRAANFGLGVMLALESFNVGEKSFNLLREVDYFSTVSGGGLAAGAYLASLHDFVERESIRTFAGVPLRPMPADIARALRRYSLSREVFIHAANLRKELEHGLQFSIYRAVLDPRFDRGNYLEDRVDEVILRRTARGRSLTLADVFLPNCKEPIANFNKPRCSQSPDSRKSVRLPYWFANATILRNGAIFSFSPDILELYKVTDYMHAMKQRTLGTDNVYEMPLAVGMKASAAFPVAIPATVLHSTIDAPDQHGRAFNNLHLSDGGLGDNLGLITAMSILEQDKAPQKILIVIDAYTGTFQPYSRLKRAPRALAVFWRTKDVHLDSWRGRHQYIATLMADGLAARTGTSVKVIFLSFDDLFAQGKRSPFWSVIARSSRRDQPTTADLYSKARGIGTNLNVTDEEQRILLEAGEFVVRRNAADLCRAFQLGSCALEGNDVFNIFSQEMHSSSGGIQTEVQQPPL